MLEGGHVLGVVRVVETEEGVVTEPGVTHATREDNLLSSVGRRGGGGGGGGEGTRRGVEGGGVEGVEG